MNIALAVEKILPAAVYYGSVTANTKTAWDAVDWQDSRRVKPTWKELEVADIPDIQDALTAKLADIMAAYKASFAPIEAAYPSEERETWPIQLEEARAVLSNPAAETPMLNVMIAMRGMGETVEDFAHKVMANNAAYRLLAGSLTGQQQRMYAEVNALALTEGASAAQIAAYPVAYTMPEGLDYGSDSGNSGE